MSKLNIAYAIISNQIFIKKSDIEDVALFETIYTYPLKEEIFHSFIYDEASDMYAVPANSYHKLNIKKYDDLRVYSPYNQHYDFMAKLRYQQQNVADKFFQQKDRIRSGLYQAKCGWGKCKPYFSKVLTDKGYLTLEELKNNYIGTTITNHKGNYNIKSFYDNKIEECFQVKTQLGNLIHGTGKHPILTWDVSLKELVYKTISEINIGDYVVGKYNTHMFGSSTIEDPYLLGMLIGDGSLTIKNLIGFASADYELENYFINKFKDYKIRTVIKDNHREYFVRDKTLYEKYVSNYNIDCLSINKPICKELRTLNKQQTILLLKGLFDTDGCANNDGTVEFCSSSKDIAYYVFEQLLNLGIISRIREKTTTHNNTFIIDINSKNNNEKFYNIIGFNIKRKQDRYKIIKNKKSGSNTTGNFIGLNYLIYDIYKNTLLGKGLSTKFNNYRKNNISLDKFEEVLNIFNSNNIEVPENIKELITCYATKVVNKISIGKQQTYDIQVGDISHAYVSEGVINHNTFVGSYFISKSQLPTLVLVHSKLLWEQWYDEIKSQVPDIPVGIIGDSRFEPDVVTIGLYQSVYNRMPEIKDRFSMTIVDEAHLCPATLFSSALNGLSSKIKIATTATPFRKDGKHVVLPDYFTPFRVQAEDYEDTIDPFIEIVKSDFTFNVRNPKAEWARAINKLTKNEKYIDYIAHIANTNIVKEKRCPLILSDRVDFLKELQKRIPDSLLMIGATGKGKDEEERMALLAQVGTKYSCVLSTKLFDEGVSCHRLDTLIPTCPHNNPHKLEQRIGRIQRDHVDSQVPKMIDVLLGGLIVSRQQMTRMQWYKSQRFNTVPKTY